MAPSAVLERVFEEVLSGEQHRRIDANERTGTGIGLSLCQRLIAAHGGTIWCGAGGHGVARALL